MAMYDNDKNISDVLAYLYENNKKELADAVLQLIKSNEQVNEVTCNCKCRVNAIGFPYEPKPYQPNVTYC